MMIYIIIITSILLFMIFLLDKSAKKMLMVIGVVSMVSGIFNIIIGLFTKYLLINNIRNVNVVGVSNYIMDKFIKNGFKFMIVGILSLIILEVLKKVYNKKVAINN